MDALVERANLLLPVAAVAPRHAPGAPNAGALPADSRELPADSRELAPSLASSQERAALGVREGGGGVVTLWRGDGVGGAVSRDDLLRHERHLQKYLQHRDGHATGSGVEGGGGGQQAAAACVVDLVFAKECFTTRFTPGDGGDGAERRAAELVVDLAQGLQVSERRLQVIYIYMYMYVYICIRSYLYTYNIYIYMCVCVCIYIYIYIYIYIFIFFI